MLVGSTVWVWFLVWTKDLQCRCMVLFRGFVGPCGLCSEGVVPFMAQGLREWVTDVV